MRCLFVTHPEVQIEPSVDVTQWGLSERGRSRAAEFASSGVPVGFDLLVSSEENKAIQTASILSDALGIPTAVDALLGENDRSATGFLEPEEFEQTADAFFAQPDRSVRGWETAVEAQERIVGAVRHLASENDSRTMIFVAHGAVGALLMCSLRGDPISRTFDQPRQGCWFSFNPGSWEALSGWNEMRD